MEKPIHFLAFFGSVAVVVFWALWVLGYAWPRASQDAELRVYPDGSVKYNFYTTVWYNDDIVWSELDYDAPAEVGEYRLRQADSVINNLKNPR